MQLLVGAETLRLVASSAPCIKTHRAHRLVTVTKRSLLNLTKTPLGHGLRNMKCQNEIESFEVSLKNLPNTTTVARYNLQTPKDKYTNMCRNACQKINFNTIDIDIIIILGLIFSVHTIMIQLAGNVVCEPWGINSVSHPSQAKSLSLTTTTSADVLEAVTVVYRPCQLLHNKRPCVSMNGRSFLTKHPEN